MPNYEVAAMCPVHQKHVFIRVEAPDEEEAIEKVLGMVIHCPWGPSLSDWLKDRYNMSLEQFEKLADSEKSGIRTEYSSYAARHRHNFVVGFRAGRKEILGVSPLPWMPATIVSVAPTVTPIMPLEPTPLETIYRISAEDAEKQISKSEWWER